MKRILYILLLVVVVSSCGDDYRKVLKSTDLKYKEDMALSYYEQEKYEKAFPLFDELITLYRGTHKAQDIYFFYAMCTYQMEDYILAGYHFKTMYKTYPRHPKAEDAAFMTAFCYYLEAPKYSLDQSYTYKAINELQLFINTHPGSIRNEECNFLIEELREKLEHKSYEIARVYYRTQHYQSAVLAYSHTLNDFPDTEHREDAMFYKMDSAYKLAINSIPSKQLQRFKEARTAYYEFSDFYPESDYIKEANSIFEKIQEEITHINNKEA